VNDGTVNLLPDRRRQKVTGKNSQNLLLHSRILDVFAEEKSKQEILTLGDYASSIENLGGWKHVWKKEKNIPDFCLSKAYESSIHPDLCDKILFTCTMKRLRMREARL